MSHGGGRVEALQVLHKLTILCERQQYSMTKELAKIAISRILASSLVVDKPGTRYRTVNVPHLPCVGCIVT